MPEIGTSALVVELPAAATLLQVAAAVRPELVRAGLPPHVTALYPFLPAPELDDAGHEVDVAVTELAAGHEVTDVLLADLVVTRGFVAIAAPALQPLTDAAADRWPRVDPYGGRFGPHPRAHLSVALGGSDDENTEIARRARELLPLFARAEALHLVVLTEHGWQLRLRAPLATPVR